MKILLAIAMTVAVSWNTVDPQNEIKQNGIATRNESTRKDIAKQDPGKRVKQIEATFDKIRWESFVEEVIRANQLSMLASRIDGWVYASGVEGMIDDFEAARLAIERAESLLRTEMVTKGSRNVIARFGDHADCVGSADLICSARSNLDRAEFTIELLMAISMSEY